MAGGTFITQNKVRPGVYINFKGVAKPNTLIGNQGVVTFPVAMSWGAEVTTLYSTDLIDGTSIAKIGFSALDAESQVFREALKYAYKAIVYRLDTGGAKALGTISTLIATAKYAGVVGNDITVAVLTASSGLDVVTYYKGVEQHRQNVSDASNVVDNDWVDFTGTGALTATAGVTLAGGLNGTVADANFVAYLNAIQSYDWKVMAFPQANPNSHAGIITFIQTLRDVSGRKVQAVLFNNSTADHEGIVSTVQGYTTANEVVAPEIFPAYVASLMAATDPDISNTYHAVPGAISITYPSGVTPYGDNDIESALASGKLVLSTRQDGAVVIEKDINTLRTFTANKGYAFSKNRVVRTLDYIAMSISSNFQVGYLGKIDNNEYGRTLLKGDIINLMNELQARGAIKQFNSLTDVSVLAGSQIDSIVVDLTVMPADAIEKIYLTVWVA